MTRPKVTAKELDNATREVHLWLWKRIDEKGDSSFSSIHEIRGVVDEEVAELKEAMHSKDHDAIVHELKDVIVGCLFGLACLQSKMLKW